ncbi:type I restriction endonuclease subunit R, EcoR124 family [Candidatus Liberibacter brunswickensis]|uniref:type I restriction endonuclease subunit R, EcoR124 family n=1 Tax=Candidatus Liberibacter brunswickensis TaxID=1968796 RepID=UPI002FDF82BE
MGFHIDYFAIDRSGKPKKDQIPPPEAVIRTIFEKHDSATNHRRFNALLATASINQAIKYFNLFKSMQKEKQKQDKNFKPLNIACVFSPPVERGKGNSNNIMDIKQLQEDLPQESADNKVEPETKKEALVNIIADYNEQYGTNHSINEFERYYRDIQKHIKNQQYKNKEKKIDITIVVDMLLTGFDSKYLNTLYVDKNLKQHGLIQAFSRTNRVLNDTKPWGNILDFRGQENEVEEAIVLFSGKDKDKSREIWLVESAEKMVEKLKKSVKQLFTFMENKGLSCEPSQIHNLKGDIAKAQFINHFKEVQKIKTQLDQYTDLDKDSKTLIEQMMPTNILRGFKAIYLDTAMELKRKQGKQEDVNKTLEPLEFDLVLFSSHYIDSDYLEKLQMIQSSFKQKMTHKQLIEDLISEIQADAGLSEEDRKDLSDYVMYNYEVGEVLNKEEIKKKYQDWKAQKYEKVLTQIAEKQWIKHSGLTSVCRKHS